MKNSRLSTNNLLYLENGTSFYEKRIGSRTRSIERWPSVILITPNYLQFTITFCIFLRVFGTAEARVFKLCTRLCFIKCSP